MQHLLTMVQQQQHLSLKKQRKKNSFLDQNFLIAHTHSLMIIENLPIYATLLKNIFKEIVIQFKLYCVCQKSEQHEIPFVYSI